MFEVFTQTTFSAAHHLIDYDGNCSRVHGHNWEVTVFVRACQLSPEGMAVDLRQLREETQTLLQEFDHSDLNEHPAFAANNPTCENIARYLYSQLGNNLNTSDRRVSSVKVTEGSNAGAYYWEE